MVNLTNAECDAIAREVQRTMYGTDDYDVLNADYERALIRAGAATVPREPTIREAVDRFLAWPLPAAFAPDGGIRFDGRMSRVTGPTGTNLFTAEQARAMFEHCLAAPGGPEAQPVACEDCPECKGTGLRDSGGVYPWGEYITIPCDCAAPQAEGRKRSTDGSTEGRAEFAASGACTSPDAASRNAAGVESGPSTPLPNAGDALLANGRYLHFADVPQEVNATIDAANAQLAALRAELSMMSATRDLLAKENGEAHRELERTQAALRTFTDFASRLHTMSDEELEAWRKAAHAAARRALEGGS